MVFSCLLLAQINFKVTVLLIYVVVTEGSCFDDML